MLILLVATILIYFYNSKSKQQLYSYLLDSNINTNINSSIQMMDTSCGYRHRTQLGAIMQQCRLGNSACLLTFLLRSYAIVSVALTSERFCNSSHAEPTHSCVN